MLRSGTRGIFSPIDPTIYKSIADRISSLPFPGQVVSFYSLVANIQVMLRRISDKPGRENEWISSQSVEEIEQFLMNSGRRAKGIISYGIDAGLDDPEAKIKLKSIKTALEEAERDFPDTKWFT